MQRIGDFQSQLTCGSQVAVEKWQTIFKQFLYMMIIVSLKMWPGILDHLKMVKKTIYLIADAETMLDYLDLSKTYTPLVF
jgi:hypothetical protein